MNINFNTAGFNAIKLTSMQQHPKFSQKTTSTGTGGHGSSGSGSKGTGK